MKLANGWAFPDGDDWMIAHMAKGGYQRRNLERVIDLTPNKGVAVDGGAHVGTWSRRFSEVFDEVYAFEPCADTFECLMRNMRAFECDNVACLNVALGARFETASMVMTEKAVALQCKGSSCIDPATKQGPVNVRPLDGQYFERLDLLKMDIEGSEVDALIGAEKTLRQFHPVVLFEDKALWKRYGYRRNQPQLFLEALGARKLDRVGCDEIWGWQ